MTPETLIIISSQPQHAALHHVQRAPGTSPFAGGIFRRPSSVIGPSLDIRHSATRKHLVPSLVQVTACWAPTPQRCTRAVDVLSERSGLLGSGRFAWSCINASVKERVVVASSECGNPTKRGAEAVWMLGSIWSRFAKKHCEPYPVLRAGARMYFRIACKKNRQSSADARKI